LPGLALYFTLICSFCFIELNNTFICLIDQLAGSDANKSAIVGKGGMDKLIKLSARYADDPTVLQEVRTNGNSCN